MTPRIHVPVLRESVLTWLAPTPGAVLVDGTLGAGGHTRALAELVGPTGLVISLDRDPAALADAEVSLKGLPVVLVHSNFAELPEALDQLKIEHVDGVLLDLGLSSDQLADGERGFSFEADGPLDMRFDPTEGEPAWKLLGRLSAEALADIIYQLGEERDSRKVARAIVEQRRTEPITQAKQLADLCRRVIRTGPRGDKIDPATRTFQALRCAVNREPQALLGALKRIPDRLKPGGRLGIISFHSLEDRPVKEAFRDDPRLEVLTKKPVLATAEELAANPRARSAKFRVAARKK